MALSLTGTQQMRLARGESPDKVLGTYNLSSYDRDSQRRIEAATASSGSSTSSGTVVVSDSTRQAVTGSALLTAEDVPSSMTLADFNSGEWRKYQASDRDAIRRVLTTREGGGVVSPTSGKSTTLETMTNTALTGSRLYQIQTSQTMPQAEFNALSEADKAKVQGILSPTVYNQLAMTSAQGDAAAVDPVGHQSLTGAQQMALVNGTLDPNSLDLSQFNAADQQRIRDAVPVYNRKQMELAQAPPPTVTSVPPSGTPLDAMAEAQRPNDAAGNAAAMAAAQNTFNDAAPGGDGGTADPTQTFEQWLASQDARNLSAEQIQQLQTRFRVQGAVGADTLMAEMFPDGNRTTVTGEAILGAWNASHGDPRYDAALDLNNDGVINALDLGIFRQGGGTLEQTVTEGVATQLPTHLQSGLDSLTPEQQQTLLSAYQSGGETRFRDELRRIRWGTFDQWFAGKNTGTLGTQQQAQLRDAYATGGPIRADRLYSQIMREKAARGELTTGWDQAGAAPPRTDTGRGDILGDEVFNAWLTGKNLTSLNANQRQALLAAYNTGGTARAEQLFATMFPPAGDGTGSTDTWQSGYIPSGQGDGDGEGDGDEVAGPQTFEEWLSTLGNLGAGLSPAQRSMLENAFKTGGAERANGQLQYLGAISPDATGGDAPPIADTSAPPTPGDTGFGWDTTQQPVTGDGTVTDGTAIPDDDEEEVEEPPPEEVVTVAPGEFGSYTDMVKGYIDSGADADRIQLMKDLARRAMNNDGDALTLIMGLLGGDFSNIPGNILNGFIQGENGIVDPAQLANFNTLYGRLNSGDMTALSELTAALRDAGILDEVVADGVDAANNMPQDERDELVASMRSAMNTMVNELGYDPNAVRDARRAQVDADFQEARLAIARQFALTPGGTQSGAAQIQVEALYAQRLREYAQIESDVQAQIVEVRQQNVQLLTDSIARLGGLDLDERQFGESMRQFDETMQRRIQEWSDQFGLDEMQTYAMVDQIYSEIANSTRRTTADVAQGWAQITGQTGMGRSQVTAGDLGVDLSRFELPNTPAAILSTREADLVRGSLEAMTGTAPTDAQVLSILQGQSATIDNMPTLEARQFAATITQQNLERVAKYDSIARELGLNERTFEESLIERDRQWNLAIGNVAGQYGLDEERFRNVQFTLDQFITNTMLNETMTPGQKQIAIEQERRRIGGEFFPNEVGTFIQASLLHDQIIGNQSRAAAMSMGVEYDRYLMGARQADQAEERLSQTWASLIGAAGSRIAGDSGAYRLPVNAADSTDARITGFLQPMWDTVQQIATATDTYGNTATGINYERVMADLSELDPEAFERIRQSAETVLLPFFDREGGFFTDQQLTDLLVGIAAAQRRGDNTINMREYDYMRPDWFSKLDKDVQSAVMGLLGSGSFTPERGGGGGFSLTAGLFDIGGQILTEVVKHKLTNNNPNTSTTGRV